MAHEFTTKLKTSNYGNRPQEVSVENINTGLCVNKLIDVEIDSADLEVKWYAEIDMREWGIESIDTGIREVTGTLRWYIHPDDLTEEDIAQIKAAGGVEMNNDDWEGSLDISGWNYVWQVCVLHSSVSPYEASLDFSTKEITIR